MKSGMASISKGQGDTHERTRLSRMEGGRFNKQGNLLMRLFLVDLCATSQNLKNLYRGLNWVQSCTVQVVSQLPGNSGQDIQSKDGKGAEGPQISCVQFAGQPAVTHVLSMTSSNKINTFYTDNSTHVLC